ncbi:hypothetical protein EMIHUDRAFT_224948 [Emiliania huxleyi CCMP1516]|uniref:Uncharacterized protein n=2 Tax=Emiliania huxleyi TaxID=2903 RepID=A0A0D3KQB2_EMIH1|nr:hypothetical protein EMIHUDRAFT_224948 [Emiliania huxleyi CCMP1516]EOD37947.1 hypothetical protein EMIHUDRAFT_224948 [Emiliania huxleyi CCMP1516]|eukprot:XP_005790376.1 hypothetical protein EMIHUDRAFT_224948 [Emiliania huxleyi CCMP1516]
MSLNHEAMRVACAGNGGRSRACDQLTEAGNVTRVLSAELQVEDGLNYAIAAELESAAIVSLRGWTQTLELVSASIAAKRDATSVALGNGSTLALGGAAFASFYRARLRSYHANKAAQTQADWGTAQKPLGMGATNAIRCCDSFGLDRMATASDSATTADLCKAIGARLGAAALWARQELSFGRGIFLVSELTAASDAVVDAALVQAATASSQQVGGALCP